MSGDPYTTHVPILAQAVLLSRIDRTVMEFGAGWGSTPLLHALCRDRRLITFETKKEWLDKFEALKTDNHQLIHIDSWETVMRVPVPDRIGLAFVDCEPGEMRAPLIKWLADKCDMVVVHDTEKDWGSGADYKYEPSFKLYRYRSDYRFLRPYTTVVSHEFRFPIDEGEKVWVPSEEQKRYYREMGIRG